MREHGGIAKVQRGSGPKLRGLLACMENLERQRAEWKPPAEMEAA